MIDRETTLQRLALARELVRDAMAPLDNTSVTCACCNLTRRNNLPEYLLTTKLQGLTERLQTIMREVQDLTGGGTLHLPPGPPAREQGGVVDV